MNNSEFIGVCFEGLLSRHPTPNESTTFADQIDSGLQPAELIAIIAASPEFASTRPSPAEFVPPGHFYSALPADSDRALFCIRQEQMRKRTELPGIQIDNEQAFRHLETIAKFAPMCPFPEKREPNHRYFFENPAYSYGDGLSLYAMIRRLSPKRIIEVGSGYSSALMLDVNELHFDQSISLTFIEPYPELLHSLFRPGDNTACSVVPTPVQHVAPAIFEELEKDDVLFIDSTHVSKLFSDVNFLFFEILPRLKSGVHIHVHDIFWPFEYPADWISEKRSWNECYALRALLTDSARFRISYFSDLVRLQHETWIHENVPLLERNYGGHIWFQAI